MMVVTSCANVATNVPLSTSTAPTLIPITPTIAVSPTSPAAVSPSETPTTVIAQIDPTADPSTWSTDVQTRFHDVLTSPNKATDQEKADYDAFMIAQWQRVAGAEGKTGYDLIGAIVDYAQQNKIYEGAPIPFSLQFMIEADGNNMIAYQASKGLDATQRINMFGMGWRNIQSADLIHKTAEFTFKQINFFGKVIKRGDTIGNQKVDWNTPVNGVSGNIVFRFNIQGVNPDDAQLVLIQMKDSTNATHYTLGVMNYTQTKTTNQDVCGAWVGGNLTGQACDSGVTLPITSMDILKNQSDVKHSTRKLVNSLMSQAGGMLHVDTYNMVDNKNFLVFQNGAIFIAGIDIANDVSLSK
jgi:hypothetical protein